MCKKLIVELGELDATFRKSDIASLKSFITSDRDVLRRPYARLESEFVRRTVFLHRLTQSSFLHDPTGNRRFGQSSANILTTTTRLICSKYGAEVYEELYKKVLSII